MPCEKRAMGKYPVRKCFLRPHLGVDVGGGSLPMHELKCSLVEIMKVNSSTVYHSKPYIKFN